MDESKETSGGRPVDTNLTEKTISPKDESTGSSNPSLDVKVVAPSPNNTSQLGSSYTSGPLPSLDVKVAAPSPNNTSQLGSSYTSVPLPSLSTQESTYFYGGYENNAANWDEYNMYANNLQVAPPGMFSDNASLMFHSGYGIDSQMAYGQFSPMANHPMSPIMFDGQLYSPHQLSVPPSFFPPPASPGLPNVTSSLQFSQNELATAVGSSQERLGDNVHFGSGSGYYIPFGSFGEGVLSGEPLANRHGSESGSYLSQLTTPGVYPQSYGILGPYEQNMGQFPQQQRPSHGFGTLTNSFPQNYPHSSSYQNLSYNAVSPSNWRVNNQSRLIPDRGGRRDRDHSSLSVSDDAHGDRNRGPRASKPKPRSSTEEISSSVPNKNGASVSESNLDLYNQPDFVTDYENAKFFVIKSYSEDNVHKSIKYKVWASTPLGNRKLDAAYREVKEMKNLCPIFLLFSVNASGQFCGVAEMIGPVDFEKDADYWQQDRWSGQFPVRWHLIKDVPNNHLRHILIENNENKPVTHSRDTQEVKLEQGIEILKIFKEHETETSILDDFSFYDERERILQEKKARQRPSSSSIKNPTVPAAAATPAASADASINQLSDHFAEAFKFEDGKDNTTPK